MGVRGVYLQVHAPRLRVWQVSSCVVVCTVGSYCLRRAVRRLLAEAIDCCVFLRSRAAAALLVLDFRAIGWYPDSQVVVNLSLGV